MKKITIDVLFPNNKDYNNSSSSGSNKLDLDSLFSGTQNLAEKKDTHVSKNLLKTIERSRGKRLKVMIDNYNLCCEKIKQADENDLDYIFFTVPKTTPNCPKYSPTSVIEYISKNLREENIDTYICKDDTLFVTWRDIELNKENEQEKERERRRRERDSSSSSSSDSD